MPATEASEADDERLEEHGPHDLAPGSADRAQGRELPRALGNGDGERVRDHEGADEQRDAAEGEQEALEEVRKLCVSLASSSAWPSPVRTWVPDGRMDLIDESSSASVVPPAAAARI